MRETSPNEKMTIIQTIIGFFNLAIALIMSYHFVYTNTAEVIGFILMAFNFVYFGWTINGWGTTIRVFFIKDKIPIRKSPAKFFKWVK